jgi:hypothetical protein
MGRRGGCTSALGRLRLAMASVVLISVLVGGWARWAPVARWMGGMCGEWAPPASTQDPRCQEDMRPLEHRAFATAKWSAAALVLASIWLLERQRRAQAWDKPER